MAALRFMTMLALTICFSAFAEEAFRLLPQQTKYQWQKSSEMKLRYACQEKSCEFPPVLKSAHLKSVKVDWVEGGTNPSAILCRELGGEVLIVTLESGDEASACRFAGKLIIHSWDLHRAWQGTR